MTIRGYITQVKKQRKHIIYANIILLEDMFKVDIIPCVMRWRGLVGNYQNEYLIDIDISTLIKSVNNLQY